MNNRKLDMDKFRIISAVLIIAIHTFPFLSINETFDFIFTHIICRIGVPFFLMVTGFFVLPKAIEDRKNLIKYTIKIIKIYVICMILYLPINIYAGQLSNIGIVEILKNIFINGTFYHLWYFPALILGIWITYLLIKHFNSKIVIVSVSLMYIIGILGDSYFGIVEKSEVVLGIYNCIFKVSEYTRNGLFYVPIFLSLGYSFNKTEWIISKKNKVILLVVSVTFMILEGVSLHYLNFQRHDSMYFMLIPVMIAIFSLILQANASNNKKLRNIATIIYIIHPMMIILIRGIAKVVNFENIMIDNTLIHYVLVVISSVLFSIIFEMIFYRSKNKVKALSSTKTNLPK